MADKSLHLQTLQSLRVVFDYYDTSFKVSNKLFRLALVSEIIDATCMFEQLFNAWSEQLPYGEGPDADVDFSYWKNYDTWESLINGAQQNACIDELAVELGNGMFSDEVSIKRRKNFIKHFNFSLKHSQFENIKTLSDFVKVIGSDKSRMLPFGNMVFAAVQTLMGILNKIDMLLTNPSLESLNNYTSIQKSRFVNDILQASNHIKEISSSNLPSKRKQNLLRGYGDTLKRNLIESGFLDALSSDYYKYDIEDYRGRTGDNTSTDDEVFHEVILADLMECYQTDNLNSLNKHLFDNRKILSKQAIGSFFVFAETYKLLKTEIGEVKPVHDNEQPDDHKTVIEALDRQTEVNKNLAEAIKEVASRPTHYHAAGSTYEDKSKQLHIDSSADINPTKLLQ